MHEDTLTSITVACNADWRMQSNFWADLITLEHAIESYAVYMVRGRGNGNI